PNLREHKTDTAADHPTDASRRFMLLGDAHLAVLALFDDRSVVRVHHAGLGMQVLDQLVVRLGVLDAGVHPDIRHECVDRHFHLLYTDLSESEHHIWCSDSDKSEGEGITPRGGTWAAALGGIIRTWV